MPGVGEQAQPQNERANAQGDQRAPEGQADR